MASRRDDPRGETMWIFSEPVLPLVGTRGAAGSPVCRVEWCVALACGASRYCRAHQLMGADYVPDSEGQR